MSRPQHVDPMSRPHHHHQPRFSMPASSSSSSSVLRFSPASTLHNASFDVRAAAISPPFAPLNRSSPASKPSPVKAQRVQVSTPKPPPPPPVEAQRWSSPTRQQRANTPGFNAATNPHTRKEIKSLEKQREELEAQGLYLEAERVHLKLTELKIFEEQRRRENVRASRVNQINDLEVAYVEECKSFEDQWTEDLRSFEVAFAQQLVDLQDRQENEMVAYVEQSAVATETDIQTRTFPPSKRLLEMRRAEKALARNRQYKQAHEVKLEADELEQRELVDRVDRIKSSAFLGEEKLREKFRQELQTLVQKNNIAKKVLVESRRAEFNNLEHRYANKKNDLQLTTYRVESMIDRRMEHLSPTPSHNRSLSSSRMSL